MVVGSEPGRGAAFTIVLPVAATKGQPDHESPGSVDPAPAGGPGEPAGAGTAPRTIDAGTAPEQGGAGSAPVPAAAPASRDAPGRPSSPGRPWLLLVVDDDATVRHLAARILERAGFEVLQADGGVAAIALYREHAAAIDAVLLDLAMPDMGGADVHRALRAIRSDVRVVVMSGFDVAEAERRFGDTPPHAFVAKPFSPGQLIEGVRRVLVTPVG
jgi:CheY-like chemotaxis protein